MVKQLALQFVLILTNAVFASAEIALISVNDTKLELLAAGGDKRAKKLLSLTKQPARFLATIQVGITLAGFLGSAFAADNFSEKLTALFISLGATVPQATLRTVSVVVITVILSFFTLVLGELVPKRIAMRKAEPLAFFMAGFIVTISRIFTPVVWLLTKSTNVLLRLFRIDPNAEDEAVTEEEIRMMVDAGSEKGTINAGDRQIIHNVFEFDNKTAADVMTHRTSIILLWLKDDDEEWERTIMENRHRFYPVCGETVDDIKGVLSTQDYLRLEQRDRKTVMEKAVEIANMIPESAKTDVLFRNMKQSRNHFVVALDEYGGMSGIVTLTDLLEALVGDFDEGGEEQPQIEKLSERTWRIDGGVSLDKVSRVLQVKLPVEEYETFGGFVFSLLGEVPGDGQRPEVSGAGMRIVVEEIKERRLEKAVVQLLEPGAEGEPVLKY
jgi:putative hemolysin